MTATHPTMHGEHRSWESEISLWRDDLRVWQQELAKIQGEIELCKHDLQRYVQTLRQHGAAIRLHEQDFGEHEHALAEYEKGGEGDDLFEFARQHRAEADHHVEQRAAHEQLKWRHHHVIAHWGVFLKAVRELSQTLQPPPPTPIPQTDRQDSSGSIPR